jgi:hypothetical protein
VGLNPGYRIADEAEAALVCGSVMEPLINLAFEGELKDVCSAEEFAALADILTDAKSSSELAESFRLVYEKKVRLGNLLVYEIFESDKHRKLKAFE